MLRADIIVGSDSGTTHYTPAVNSFKTGSLMAGMRVTVHFADGGSETATWTSTGPDSGGAFGTGWSVVQAGNTFTGDWTLANNTGRRIDRVLIDGAPGDTVFDRTFDGLEGTPDSAAGLDINAATDLNIVATYRDQVAITGNAPIGDLYRSLDLRFSDDPAFGGGRLVFTADTDAAQLGVPEPTTLVLWTAAGLSLAGYTWYRRRRAARGFALAGLHQQTQDS
jgi:hypothetical protein